MVKTNTELNGKVKYTLTITKDAVISTDIGFPSCSGDDYKPDEAYFVKHNETRIDRKRQKGENSISNKTLPYIAFQIYEENIVALSDKERETFPTGINKQGIFTSIEAYREHYSSMGVLEYDYGAGKKFYIFSWNIFSTIDFVQECLKRFGEEGDRFILIYHKKEEKEGKEETDEQVEEANLQGEDACHINEYKNPYSSVLLESKNLIFRGAPGTGKTFLAKEIAADIISNGRCNQYEYLSDEQKKQVEFVQFHPSYDYSDFVEGLRPKIYDDGSMGFELRDGIFKSFVSRARKNYEDSEKSRDVLEKELSVQEAITAFFDGIEFDETEFKTINGNRFTISSVDDKHIRISIPGNALANKLSLSLDEVRIMLESGEVFDKIKDVTAFFGKTYATQAFSYEFALYKEIGKKIKSTPNSMERTIELKNYIFIIDEINRGEISKIVGELFFALDPGYRGKAGGVSTQYSNLHTNPDEKFYIPENVYIIGTMNDIDRSVDSFDFAMRRRFRFVEIKADDRLEMLSSLEEVRKGLADEAIDRMTSLNKAIVSVEDLNENYQIGPAYFLKLKYMDFDHLWTDCLKPLLQEYVRGMYDEEGIMNRFAIAYGYQMPEEGETNESAQD